MVTTITPTIVNVNTYVTAAPAPSTYQQSGALVSLGGTAGGVATNAYQYCGTLSAVTALVGSSLGTITTSTWASGVATITAAAALNLATGTTFTTTITLETPSAWNGTFLCTVTGTNTFTYPLATNPGTITGEGSYLLPSAQWVLDAATTHFAQGNAVGLYILELGAQTSAAAGITALQTWITNNPGNFYLFRVPPWWDGAALNTMTANYDSPSGKMYFVITTTTGTIADYPATNKANICIVNSPTQAVTEDQGAVIFYNILQNNPSAASPLAPLAFRYAYGVTPWNQNGNITSINNVLTAYGNLILTGAEGGISTATLFRGTTMDGQQFNFWYAVDWFQIQIKQALANAIINGSNSNPPLIYNQNGINTLLAVAQNICNSGVSFNLALSASVTATPFATFTAQNPADYDAGIYNGFALTVTPQLGFESLTFNIDAVQFA